ncbi:MAG TPA: pentapeptide repeat-containing protein [Leptolyngbyaceae cyanobacterium]
MLEQNSQLTEVSRQERFRKLPLEVRRWGAWVTELGLIVASGAIPFGIGWYVNSPTAKRLVPLNPVLVVTQNAIAQTLGLPVYQKKRQVAPATNFLWTAALVAPLALTSWQLYRLAVKGQTLPKSWFGVQVVKAPGINPGIKRILLREAIGRSSLLIVIAFTVWRYTGAYPDLEVLTGLIGLLLVADTLPACFDSRRQTLHDKIAGTLVLDASKANQPISGIFPPSPPHWLIKKQGDRGINNRKGQQVPSRRVGDLVGQWIIQYPWRSLMVLFILSMVAMTATFATFQIYVQNETNRRISEQHKNEVFLSLVKQLNSTSNGTSQEKQVAILALAANKEDPRVVRLLVNLIKQEKDPEIISLIQQSLVRIGWAALPELHQLNQTLTKELSFQQSRYSPEKEKLNLSQNPPVATSKDRREEESLKDSLLLISLQLRATQEAIAQILNLEISSEKFLDLSQSDLGKTNINQIEADLNITSFKFVLNQKDLSRINFSGANLTGASFQGSQFWGAGKDGLWQTFDDAIADLSNAELKQANLSGANLNHVSLENSNLSHAILDRANLSQAYLTDANLSSAKLIGANLQQSVLKNATLTGADLTEANLNRTNLQAASLSRVSAVGTQLSFANLTRSDWRKSDLSMANLSEAKLQNANLSSTKLVGTNLRNARLENANLQNADLKMADLRGANLDGADFEGVSFIPISPSRPDQFVKSTPNLASGTRVIGVDFSKVKNLNSEQLTYICSQKGRHPRCQ